MYEWKRDEFIKFEILPNWLNVIRYALFWRSNRETAMIGTFLKTFDSIGDYSSQESWSGMSLTQVPVV